MSLPEYTLCVYTSESQKDNRGRYHRYIYICVTLCNHHINRLLIRDQQFSITDVPSFDPLSTFSNVRSTTIRRHTMGESALWMASVFCHSTKQAITALNFNTQKLHQVYYSFQPCNFPNKLFAMTIYSLCFVKFIASDCVSTVYYLWKPFRNVLRLFLINFNDFMERKLQEWFLGIFSYCVCVCVNIITLQYSSFYSYMHN